MSGACLLPDLLVIENRFSHDCVTSSNTRLIGKYSLKLHVDGKGLADAPPKATGPIDHLPRLTLPMAAAIQGFPPTWRFYGRKTAAYRQIGNAFPPPVARAVGENIRSAILRAREESTARSDRL